jgi:hypothetical protein
MSNTSSDWAQAITKTDGGLNALARALLHRSVLVSGPSLRPLSQDPTDAVDEANEQARFFSPAKTTKPTHADAVGSEDVLCLVLVILTGSILGTASASAALAALRERTSPSRLDRAHLDRH